MAYKEISDFKLSQHRFTLFETPEYQDISIHWPTARFKLAKAITGSHTFL